MMKNNILKYDINSNAVFRLYKNLNVLKNRPMQGQNIVELRAKFQDMLTLILKAFVDKDLQELKLAFAVDAGIDYDYTEFYENVVKIYLAQSYDSKNTLDNVFPKNACIDNDTHFITMQEIITQLLPPEIRNNALEYFQNTILPKSS